MHKRGNLAKQTAREQSKTGWTRSLRERKHDLLGELNQKHISPDLGHHMPRAMGARNWQQMRGRG